jgi:IMP cyclohydrolase
MKINKKITDNITNKVDELKRTLEDTTIELLAMAFDEDNVDIKFERPITIVNASTDDMGRSSINSMVVDTISFKQSGESNGHTYRGYYILSMGERVVGSSTFMTLDGHLEVYKAVKKLVRHKE